MHASLQRNLFLVKEHVGMFTTADNYILSISPEVPPENPVRQLILGAVMCIDMVLKE